MAGTVKSGGPPSPQPSVVLSSSSTWTIRQPAVSQSAVLDEPYRYTMTDSITIDLAAHRQKKRKRSRKTWVRECDAAWSKLVRSLGRCERCERKDGVLHAHHIVGRRNRRTRWEPRNGVCLCYRCHRWAEEDAVEFADWIRSVRPDDVVLLFRLKAEPPPLHTDRDLAEILADLEGAVG